MAVGTQTDDTSIAVSNAKEAPATATAGKAAVIDHIGPLRDECRVTIMQLARVKETYELRWRENVRLDDGTIVRERRTEPGGNSKSATYGKAEKIHRTLNRSAAFHGRPPRPATEPGTPGAAKPKTVKQVCELRLAQHPATPPNPPPSRTTSRSCGTGGPTPWPKNPTAAPNSATRRSARRRSTRACGSSPPP